MTYAAGSTEFHPSSQPYRKTASVPAKQPQTTPSNGLLRRLLDAIMDSRQRHIQRDVERYIATHGSKMTDALERDINNRTLGDGWNFRR